VTPLSFGIQKASLSEFILSAVSTSIVAFFDIPFHVDQALSLFLVFPSATSLYSSFRPLRQAFGGLSPFFLVAVRHSKGLMLASSPFPEFFF